MTVKSWILSSIMFLGGSTALFFLALLSIGFLRELKGYKLYLMNIKYWRYLALFFLICCIGLMLFFMYLLRDCTYGVGMDSSEFPSIDWYLNKTQNRTRS